jgi:hypothetical protein
MSSLLARDPARASRVFAVAGEVAKAIKVPAWPNDPPMTDEQILDALAAIAIVTFGLPIDQVADRLTMARLACGTAEPTPAAAKASNQLRDAFRLAIAFACVRAEGRLLATGHAPAAGKVPRG